MIDFDGIKISSFFSEGFSRSPTIIAEVPSPPFAIDAWLESTITPDDGAPLIEDE